MPNRPTTLTYLMALALCTVTSFNMIYARTATDLKKPSVLSPTTAVPNTQNCSHRSGNVWMTITNWGFYGSQFQQNQLTELYCLGPGVGYATLAPSVEFPAGTGNNYLFAGALWIGAVVGQDTLVSVGFDGWQLINEMYPEAIPNGGLIRRSSIPTDPDYDPTAISDAEYSAVYYDTLVSDDWTGRDPKDNRPHIPLGLRIRQESYSWGAAANQNFIIFKYHITNIGSHHLEKLFIGLFVDADVWNAHVVNGFADDISGSYEVVDPYDGHATLVGWSADNDGDPGAYGEWAPSSTLGILGVSLLDFPTTPLLNFNWWVSNGDATLDWGPRLKIHDRNFGTGGTGTPEGDKNKYFVLSEPERDYDQLWSAIDFDSLGWFPPNSAIANDVANGFDTHFLFSFGPLDLQPGDSTEFAFVVALGDNFHRNPDDFARFFDAHNPQAFYNSLDFSALTQNVLAARSLYRCVFNKFYGDIDGSCSLDIADVVYLINYIFNNGPAPAKPNLADANGDCGVDIADAVYLVNYIFGNGAAPQQGCVR